MAGDFVPEFGAAHRSRRAARAGVRVRAGEMGMIKSETHIKRTETCKPTLNDRDVVEFCKNGYVIVKAVVPDQVNRRACAYADEHPQLFPNELLSLDWFVEGVLLNAQAAGAVRALLGRNFELPKLMVNHRQVCPNPSTLGWHVDGGSRWGPELNDLQVFYLPQDTPVE